MFKRIVTAVALFILTTGLSVQASLLVDLTPAGGAVSGNPGGTVGWGYSVSNNSPTEWLVLTLSEFNPLPGWGSYTDYVALPANFVLLAPSPGPGDSASQSFSIPLQTGTGSFLIDGLAIPGTTATGNIIFSYDRYDGDPTNGGNYIDPATTQVPASVTVLDASAVPEPSTYLLLCLSLGVVGYARTRMNRG
jgi:hypothetical protein